MSVFNTLYSRLALVLFLLVCLISLAFVLLARFANLHYQQELTQKLNSDLARNLDAGGQLYPAHQYSGAGGQSVGGPRGWAAVVCLADAAFDPALTYPADVYCGYWRCRHTLSGAGASAR